MSKYELVYSSIEDWDLGTHSGTQATELGLEGESGYWVSQPLSLSFVKSMNGSALSWEVDNSVSVYSGLSSFADIEPSVYHEMGMGEPLSFLPLGQELEGLYLWIKIVFDSLATVSRLSLVLNLDLPDVPPYIPQPEVTDIMALSGDREVEFIYTLLDRNEREIRVLDNIQEGSLEPNMYNAIKTTGALTMIDTGLDIDFLNDRVAISVRIRSLNYDWEKTYPLGVYLMTTPAFDYDGAVRKWNVEVYDKLLILEQDAVAEPFVVPAETNVVQAIREIILSTGEDKINIQESPKTTLSARVWEAGTSKLSIINNLLDSINYYSLNVDGLGNYTSETYKPPSSRSPVMDFVDDRKSLYSVGLKVNQDYFRVANKVVLVVSNPDLTEPITVSKTLDEYFPDSPFSYANRGRWIVDVREVEATDISVLEEMAKRILREGIQVSQTMEISHPWLPLELYDVIRFRNMVLGMSENYAIISQSIPLGYDKLVTSTVRRVV